MICYKFGDLYFEMMRLQLFLTSLKLALALKIRGCSAAGIPGAKSYRTRHRTACLNVGY
ncbi:hypothetical protein [uncultured Pontibacter sp.]|uniref:hypothetical protein n=1 Tax=uncultured Pontibacter sp. TaxID=453356 RepID=UPI00262FFEF1|nr:hypothetical protein [uncultured Pontibacter sp.]